MIRITNVKLNLDDAVTVSSELANLKKLVISKYKLKSKNLINLEIFKKGIDARRKTNVHFVYTIDIEINNEVELLSKKYKDVSMRPDLEYKDVENGDTQILNRPVIVGFGPSGIFAALLLARRGYKPIVLERGYDVKRRTKEWNEFITTGNYKENASILYGEGGAGTFSDGKLTTSVKNLRCRFVLKELIKAGADPKILYVNKPHVGTDVLKVVIKNIREDIISCGGEVRFDSKVTSFEIVGNELKAVIVNNQERVQTNVCLLGVGHSARETFEELLSLGMEMAPKPFSIGVRIEHNQELINKAQYGEFHDHPALGAAEYKLAYHSKSGRSAYTFCMCPGGFVVNSTSEENTVVTNGMSYSKRNGVNANSALLVNVTPSDYPGTHPLSGIDFQKKFEKLAFSLAGRNYKNPVQLVGDFLKDKKSDKIGSVIPTIKPGYEFIRIQDIYPRYITDTLKEALSSFDKKIKGFSHKDAILTGPETRSSSPVRITRDKDNQSSIKGLYPMGEGPGYAGGIMSAAVDGMKTAEIIIQKFTN